MAMTTKQRNFLILCGALLFAYYVGRSVISSMQREAYFRQQAQRAAEQRAKAKQKEEEKKKEDEKRKALAAATAAASAPKKFSPLTTTSNLSGTWKGEGALTGHGICTLRLELRETENTPGHYTGYSTLSCENVAPLMQPGARNRAYALKNKMDPAASILSGVPENGSIHFHVDKTINTHPGGCAATSFTATPFGTNKIAVQWQEGECQGGEILLGRSGR
jgi:hypothetical protein